MKKALWLVGALMLVSAPLHAYVSSGSVMNSSTTSSTDPALTTDDPSTTEPADPTIGVIDVRHERQSCEDPGNPVPEPGTMAITSMGLLAAAALRKRFGKK